MHFFLQYLLNDSLNDSFFPNPSFAWRKYAVIFPIGHILTS